MVGLERLGVTGRAPLDLLEGRLCGFQAADQGVRGLGVGLGLLGVGRRRCPGLALGEGGFLGAIGRCGAAVGLEDLIESENVRGTLARVGEHQRLAVAHPHDDADVVAAAFVAVARALEVDHVARLELRLLVCASDFLGSGVDDLLHQLPGIDAVIDLTFQVHAEAPHHARGDDRAVRFDAGIADEDVFQVADE